MNSSFSSTKNPLEKRGSGISEISQLGNIGQEIWSRDQQMAESLISKLINQLGLTDDTGEYWPASDACVVNS